MELQCTFLFPLRVITTRLMYLRVCRHGHRLMLHFHPRAVHHLAVSGQYGPRWDVISSSSNSSQQCSIKSCYFNPPPPPTQCLFNVQQFLPRIDTPNTPLPQEERRGEVDTASTHSWLGTKMRRRTDEHCKKLSVIPTRTLCDQAITFYEEP